MTRSDFFDVNIIIQDFMMDFFCCFSSAMEAPSTCTHPAARIRSTPPGRRSITSPEDQRLRLLFTEAEYDIIMKNYNSQWVKAWIYFYRICLKDPLAFALVK